MSYCILGVVRVFPRIEQDVKVPTRVSSKPISRVAVYVVNPLSSPLTSATFSQLLDGFEDFIALTENNVAPNRVTCE